MNDPLDRLRPLMLRIESEDTGHEPAIQIDRPVLLERPIDEDTLGTRLQQDPAAHYLLSLRSASSRRTQAAQLRKLAKYLGATDWHQIDWARLGYAGANALLARLAADEPSAAGFNAARAALRGVFHQAFLLGRVGHETLLRVQSIKGERISREKEPSGRYLSAGELKLLFENCDDDTRRGRRDAAVLAILAFTGLRRAEAAALELRDVRLGEDIVVRRGKNRKARRVPLIAPATDRVQDWLLARGTEPGSLFRRVSWKDRVLDSGISDQAIYDIVRNRSGPLRTSPHDLRRTFVSDLLAASQDLSAARRLAGHASTDTTVIYDRRAEIADKRAMEQLGAVLLSE